MRALAAALLLSTSALAADSVVLICIDDLRADRAAAARGGRPLMPRLQRFAGQAQVFEQAVAQAPWTLPSMMTVFTAMTPRRHGITNRFAAADVNETAVLPASIKTLAEAFRAAGRETAAFTGGGGVEGGYGFSRGFEVYADSAPFSGFERTAPAAIEWLRAREGRPFLLFVHGYDMHGQGPGMAGEERRLFLRRRSASIEGRPERAPPAEISRLRRSYDRRAAETDARLGRLLDELDAIPGVSSRAVVAIFSDHGEELFERGGVDHGMTLHEEVLRVPLMIRVPGVAPRRISRSVRLMDLGPTLLELAGIDDPGYRAQAEGESLGPFLGRSSGAAARDALAETDFLYRTSKRALRAADGRKLILDLETLEYRLYHLGDDPGESRDLAAREPERASAMLARLRSLLAERPEDSEGAASPPAGFRETVARADKLRREGKLEEAKGLYDAAARADPAAANRLVHAGYVSLLRGREREAEHRFEQAELVSGGDPSYGHHHAVMLLRRGRSAEAAAAFEAILKRLRREDRRRSNDYVHTLYWLAWLKHDEGSRGEAERHARELLEIAPLGSDGWATAQIILLEGELRDGQPPSRLVSRTQEMLRSCDGVQCEPGVKARLQGRHIRMLLLAGRREESRRALESHVELLRAHRYPTPGCRSKRRHWSAALERAREIDAALARRVLEEALADPNCAFPELLAPMRAELGAELEQKGDLPGAREAYAAALEGFRLLESTASVSELGARLDALGPGFEGHGLSYAGPSRFRTELDRGWAGGSRRLLAREGVRRLRVVSEPAADEARAGRVLSEWRARFLGQFEGDAAYPGMITRRVDAGTELRPRELSGRAGERAWAAPATSRLTFGAGSADLAPYRALVRQFWCARPGRVVELALFEPRESFDEARALAEARAFSCE